MREIIKQPNGMFAIYDHGSDVLLGLNHTEKEVIAAWGERARLWAEQDAKDILEELKGKKKFRESTMTYLQALKSHVKHEVNCSNQDADGKWVVDEKFNIAIRHLLDKKLEENKKKREKK